MWHYSEICFERNANTWHFILLDWFHFVYFISFIHFVHFITLICCCHISKGRHIQALKKGVAGGRVQTRRTRCCSLQASNGKPDGTGGRC